MIERTMDIDGIEGRSSRVLPTLEEPYGCAVTLTEEAYG